MTSRPATSVSSYLAALALVAGCFFELTPPATDGSTGGSSGIAGAGGSGANGSGGTANARGGAAGGGAGGGGATAGAAAGCADGAREAYISVDVYPDIAACAGGFTIPGIQTPESLVPGCRRGGGDDGDNPNGDGCSVEDLCEEGWHVCSSRQDVIDHSPAAMNACPRDAGEASFWATRQTLDDGGSMCAPENEQTSNDIVGCADFGDNVLTGFGCEPLDRRMAEDDCLNKPPWSCPGNEAETVIKPGPVRGGVLCCRNS